MKKLILLLIIPFLIPDHMFAQVASDYYPMHVGDYWVEHTDTFGGYQPTTSRRDIEAIDLINGIEYFRMAQRITADDGSSESMWYFWVRSDSSGGVMGAFGDTSIVDSAEIFDTPLPSIPNGIVNLGYSWEYDFPGTGVGVQHWDCLVESISDTVRVPAGEFIDCIKIRIIITDASGDTNQIHYSSYAKEVGEVLNTGWNIWQENFEFELIEYSVQSVSIDHNAATGVPIHFSLHQNYPNPFNPLTTINYDLPEQSQVLINIYDILGREIQKLVNNTQNAGYKSVTWDGIDEFGGSVGTGIYLYQIKAGDFIQTKKMLLLR